LAEQHDEWIEGRRAAWMSLSHARAALTSVTETADQQPAGASALTA
jgi:hypothetical protein